MVTAGMAGRQCGIGANTNTSWGWFADRAAEFQEFLLLWAERQRVRRALARMDAHLLKDIGLTPGEAENEIQKPFWRP